MKAGTLLKPRETLSDFKTFDSFMEDALQVPFDEKYVKPELFDRKTIDAITAETEKYESQFLSEDLQDDRYPFRAENELRVGFFSQRAYWWTNCAYECVRGARYRRQDQVGASFLRQCCNSRPSFSRS